MDIFEKDFQDFCAAIDEETNLISMEEVIPVLAYLLKTHLVNNNITEKHFGMIIQVCRTMLGLFSLIKKEQQNIGNELVIKH